MHAQVADSFTNSHENVFLAGDAAHRFPPAGQLLIQITPLLSSPPTASAVYLHVSLSIHLSIILSVSVHVDVEHLFQIQYCHEVCH